MCCLLVLNCVPSTHCCYHSLPVQSGLTLFVLETNFDVGLGFGGVCV